MIDPIKALVEEITMSAESWDGRKLGPEAGEPDCCKYHRETWVKMRDALVGLLAEREEMISSLLGR